MFDSDAPNPHEYPPGAVPASLPSLRSTTDLESMGDFYFSAENWSLALEYYEKAYQAEQEGGSTEGLWRLAFKLGDSYRRKGLYREAGEWFYLAQRRLKGREESMEYGLVLDRIGSVLMNTGAPEEGLKSCFKAYELLKNSNHHAEVAEILNRIAIMYMRLGYPSEAEEFFTDALSSFRRVDHHLGITCCYTNLGLLKKNACRFEEALALSRKGLHLAREHSLQKLQINLMLNIGIIHFKLHRNAEAADHYMKARRLAKQNGDEAMTVSTTLSLGRVQARLGNRRRAEQLLLQGRVLAEKNGQLRSVALADEFLGELAEARGDLVAAESNLRSALAQAERIAPRGDLVVEALQRLSRVRLAAGHPQEALELAQRALDLGSSNGEIYELGYLHATRAQAWARMGEREKAVAEFRNSVHAFQHTENGFQEQEALLAFARFLEASGNLEDALRARKILDRLTPRLREEDRQVGLFDACIMLGRVELRLGNEDGAMLALIDAEAALPEEPGEAERSQLESLKALLVPREERPVKPAPEPSVAVAPASGETLITRDPAFLEMLELTRKVAATSAGILLMGETGTGKGVLARMIHQHSPRRERRFVHVNCAALPEELLESELFGHVKGSFTGAIQDKAGLIRAAEGGTLFLDEVAKTSLRMQGKLLQFLDTQEIRPVGSNDSARVEVRLITASKSDLKKMAEQGLFLEDLYFRLNDFPLRLPPLRDRPRDIPLLAEHFLGRSVAEFGGRARRFSPEAMELLNSHPWPGNVRELEKVVRRALLLGAGQEVLGPECIHLEEGPLASAADAGADLKLQDRLGRLERELVEKALRACQWNRSQASRELGISYPTLLQKIRKYGLAP